MKRLAAIIAMSSVLSVPVWATSIFVQGTVTAVNETGYSVKGYDHYNAPKKGTKIVDTAVKYAKECAFVLDSRVMDRKLVVVPGRKSYAIGSSAGAMLVVALSEAADREVGELVAVDGGKLKLSVAMGTDKMEVDVPVSAAAVQQAAGLVGKTVRVLPARPPTLLAFSAAALVKPAAAVMPVTIGGVLRGTVDVPALTIFKAGKAEEFAFEAKKPGVLADMRGFPGHGAPDLAGIGAGSPATVIRYFKRPGVPNTWLVLQAPDVGRSEGMVQAVNGNQVTVSVLTATGAKDETVTLSSDAVVKVDGKDAGPAALKPGMEVSVFAAREQQVVAATAETAAGR